MAETQSVYVVVAMDDDCRVRECYVRSDMDEAMALRETLSGIYGGRNVCVANRGVDDNIPPRVVGARMMQQFDEIIGRSKK